MLPGVKGSLNSFLDLPEILLPHAISGPLSGYTFAVKDIFDITGYKTGVGNPDIYQESEVKLKNAHAVQKLLDAGARFVGKTQTEEMVWSLSGLSTHLPSAINPKAPNRTTGGSSSGSAAVVSACEVDMALCSDTIGSIRGPASFCGIIGGPSLDVAGWYARDIDVYEKVGEVLLDKRELPKLDIKNAKIVTLKQFNELLLGEEEKREYKRMVDVLEKIFGDIVILEPLKYSFDELLNIVSRIRGYETWSLFGKWFAEKDRNLMPPVKSRFIRASSITKEQNQQDVQTRELIKQELFSLLTGNRIMMLPTTPSCSLLRTASHDEWDQFRDKAGKLFSLSCLSGFPEISIPLGKVHGAPFGISLLGPENSDKFLIKIARKVLEYKEQ